MSLGLVVLVLGIAIGFTIGYARGCLHMEKRRRRMGYLTYSQQAEQRERWGR